MTMYTWNWLGDIVSNYFIDFLEYWELFLLKA